VDYSTLNNEKKSLHDGGESSQTFFGMFAWVKKAKPRTHALTRTHVRTPTHTCARQVRPKIVILENVCGGPWEDMRRIFEEIGYSADYMRLDTKRYYIPQALLNACL
jgi:site-specific DNA-cytosine methylase